ncbi:MAG: TetR/AcrR family transcriptional regulator [Deltaproteobacteria bacterium]
MVHAIPTELLAVAARLVTERGADGFTMDDLARASKLSRATLYRRAKSREAVVDALRANGAPIAPTTDTRARILAGARTAFCRAGFEATTVEEIAAEAGVGLATVYRHFGDKDGVVAAFFDEFTPRRTAREFATRATGDLQADLELFALRVLAGLQQEGPIVRLMMLEALRGSEYITRMRALSPTRTLGTLVRLLEPHAAAGRLASRDADALAQSFGGMILAFAVMGPLLRGATQTEPAETARFITELFLRGALASRKKHR